MTRGRLEDARVRLLDADLGGIQNELEPSRDASALEQFPDAPVRIRDDSHPISPAAQLLEDFSRAVSSARPQIRAAVLVANARRRGAPCGRVREPQLPQDGVEKVRESLFVGGFRVSDHPGADLVDGSLLGSRESPWLVGYLRGAANAFAVDVDQRPARVEQDGSDSRGTRQESSARAAVSSSSARRSTSAASKPSTRMRSSGSVPE